MERPIMATTNSDARINFRLNSDLKKTIEDAAAEMGQSISDFAISTLVQAARKVLQDQHVTRLSERDRQVFAALLDDSPTEQGPRPLGFQLRPTDAQRVAQGSGRSVRSP